MAIFSVPNILIQGNNTFCGGYVYNLQRNIGFGNEPSTLSLSLISELGTYLTPQLNALTPYNIQIGNNLSLDYYAIESELQEAPEGNILNVEFVDGSIILDRYAVHLHKQAGDATTLGYNVNESQKLIILGQEFHPCDTSNDGVLDQIDITNRLNPCDPCPYCPPNKYDNYCADLTCTQIFEVGYNFNHLLGAINLLGIQTENTPSTNNKYFAEYKGTLRQVLENWGQDFAFTFVWTESNKLRFIDLRQPLIINDTMIEKNYVRERRTRRSLRGTQSRTAISYYARQGEPAQVFTCTKTDYPTLQCLKLSDLYPTGFSGAAPLYHELSCIFSYYSPHFRDAYWWHNYFGITDSGNAETARDNNTVMAPLGNMQILRVITTASPNVVLSDGRSVTAISGCLTEINSLQRDRATGQNGYFIVAKRDETEAQYRVQQEQRLAGEFIGQYFIKKYNPQFCGGGYRLGSIDCSAPSNNKPTFFPAGTSITALDFTKFNHAKNSTVGNLISEENLTDSIVMMHKVPKWIPPDTDIARLRTFENNVASGIFYQIDDGKPD
ncbi:MAG: hypothetical protein AABY22_01080, partial [Nanoarchaeota archaeon]